MGVGRELMAGRLAVMVGFTAIVLAAASVATSRAQTGQTMPPLVIESMAGRDNFDRYCAPCHGRDGRGEGPVATALKTRPADLTSLARRNDGLFPHERVVSFVTGTGRDVTAHGSLDMPVWGPIFRGLDPSDVRAKQRIDNVVAHIESLQAPSTAVNDPGSQLFRTHCSACHGTTGRGDGPMADQLRRTPPDLTKYTARNGGVFPSERVSRIIDGRDVPSHGNREMPVWGDVFKTVRGGSSAEAVKARIAAIVKYLEGIQERAADLRQTAPVERHATRE
jgi:mono/diheme cytochrome c family protein